MRSVLSSPDDVIEAPPMSVELVGVSVGRDGAQIGGAQSGVRRRVERRDAPQTHVHPTPQVRVLRRLSEEEHE